ncbi:DegT/DnrJ/EryC1/StrS family aminotransferase [Sesbania bispinosa]|nr:DegT/DnrJ/EryC1/StrS family aminotransferase [Sesbania bispinosa]
MQQRSWYFWAEAQKLWILEERFEGGFLWRHDRAIQELRWVAAVREGEVAINDGSVAMKIGDHGGCGQDGSAVVPRP